MLMWGWKQALSTSRRELGLHCTGFWPLAEAFIYCVQENSSSLQKQSKPKGISDAQEASMKQIHSASLDAIFQSREDGLSLSLQPAPSTNALALPVPQSSGGTEAQTKGKTKAKHATGPAGAGQVVQVDRLLQSCKDPLVAASKVRKATLRIMNQLKAKLVSAKSECQSALNDIRDDFDSEETSDR